MCTGWTFSFHVVTGLLPEHFRGFREVIIPLSDEIKWPIGMISAKNEIKYFMPSPKGDHLDSPPQIHFPSGCMKKKTLKCKHLWVS